MASEQITAIDIGTNSIKVAQFEKTDAGAKRDAGTTISLINLGMADYPRSSATEEIDDEVIANTLQGIFDHKIKTKSAVLSVPRELITTRKLTNFPMNATDEQIKGMVETQAEIELPFSTSEMVFDYHNLRRTEDQISVDLVAARRDAVERYVKILERLDIEPIVILPSVYATAALAMSQFTDAENREIIMLADIGAGRTDLCIFRSGRILFNRSIPIGGNDLTHRYGLEDGLTFADAEERKRTVATLVRETPAAELTREWADDLILQLDRSIQAAMRNLLDRSVRPDELWIGGGGSQVPGLGGYISDQLEVPLTEWNPFEAITDVQLPSQVANQISEDYNRFAVALGLGVNAFDERIDLNLVLPEIIRKKEQAARKHKTIRYAVAAAALIVTIGAAAIGWGQYRQNSLESVAGQLEQYKSDKSEAVDSLTHELVMMKMLDDRVSVLDVLKELTERLPKRTDVALTSFKIDRLDDIERAGLTVNAEASSYENISQLISRIGNSEIFTNIKPGQVSSTERNRKQVFMVRIKCQIAKNAVKLIAEAKERAMAPQPSEELAVAKSDEQESGQDDASPMPMREGRMRPGGRPGRSGRFGGAEGPAALGADEVDRQSSESRRDELERGEGRAKRRAEMRRDEEMEIRDVDELERQERIDLEIDERRDLELDTPRRPESDER